MELDQESAQNPVTQLGRLVDVDLAAFGMHSELMVNQEQWLFTYPLYDHDHNRGDSARRRQGGKNVHSTYQAYSKCLHTGKHSRQRHGHVESQMGSQKRFRYFEK